MTTQKITLRNEIKDFRNLGHEFLNKEVSIGDFKGKSGGMGVYAERGAKTFMIRLRTHSGVLKMNDLRLINSFIDKYNLKNIHLTTRQAIQLHGLGLDDVCDIMEVSLENDLYTRGGGGNFPRNISLSPMTGVEKNEAFDATSVAQKVTAHLMARIETFHLPRKLKIAISTSANDDACATINDLGFIGKVENNEPYFEMYIAGGLGSNPAKGIKYPKKVKPSEILYYVEAMISLFIAEGDYKNKAKARTRYIPVRMGEKEFLECYENHLKNTFDTQKLDLEFDLVPSVTLKEYTHKLKETPYLIPQRQDGLYTLILHPTCGILDTKTYKTLVEFLEENKEVSARLSMDENIYVRNLTEENVEKLQKLIGKVANTHKIEQSLSCVGVPTCQMGIEESQQVVKSVLEHLEKNNIDETYLPSIQVSGCKNSCARHQVAEIGFIGMKKRVGEHIENVFTLFNGGIVKENETKLGEQLGEIIDRDIPTFTAELANTLNDKKMNFNEYMKENRDSFISLVKKYSI